MTPTQRKAMQDAIDALEDLRKFGVKQSKALFAVREALKEDNEGSFDRADPAVEPARPDILEKLAYHQLESKDLSLDDCLTYLQTNGWHKVMGRTERQMILQITELLAAAPVCEPQTVLLLTDEEISDIAIANPPDVHTYGRAIEKSVRRKAGL